MGAYPASGLSVWAVAGDDPGQSVTIQPRTHSKMAQKAGKMKKTVTVFVAFHLFMKKRVRPVAKPASMPRKSESRTTAVTAMGAFMPRTGAC